MDLLGKLWNCEKDFYSDCSSKILQKTIDYIKNKQIHFTAKRVSPVEVEIDMNIHLQRRITNLLTEKYL